MKRVIIVLFAFMLIVSCKKETNDYVSVSGKISNTEAKDSLIVIRGKSYQKKIKLDSDGIFKDTLILKEADLLSFTLGRSARFTTYLRNGNDLKINFDAKDVLNTIDFKGQGAATNNYIQQRMLAVQDFNKERLELAKLDSTAFHNKVDAFEKKMSSLLTSSGTIDTALVKMEKEGLGNYLKGMRKGYQKQHALLVTLGKGKPSPDFKSYENHKGGKTSLSDLRGKFVYIDVWATWCKPCLGQIPALKELEKKYRRKNIEFVSISTDKPNKYDAWKKMVTEKGMTGVQLYAGKDQSFQTAYQISSIPRFILIDPKGNIVESNAPRPSQTAQIEKLFAKAGVK